MKPKIENPKKDKLSAIFEEWQNTILFITIGILLLLGHRAINGHWFMEEMFHPVVEISSAGEYGSTFYFNRTHKEIPDSVCIYLLEVSYRGRHESEYVTLEEIHSMKCELLKNIDIQNNSWDKAQELANLKCN